ncbi:class I glutamine amidotransferase-like protein [Lipomyces oligophaga]|uniref:class I glutamine amidotransferase-like protein n=1 Tax=Lipomyces oligophaga TaxID=45792 RepID=UPI0034CF1AE4
MTPPSISQISSPREIKALRLAILETDPDLVTVSGSFAQLFRTLFTNSVTQKEELAEHATLEIKNFNVVAGVYPSDPSMFDGILVTGSRATAFDSDPWILQLCAFLKHVYDDYDNVRLVGVCFGHQIIARALGGVVEENPAGWEVAVTELTLDEAGVGSKLFPESSLEGKLLMQEMHRDHVAKAPAGVCVFACTDKSPIQGMYVPDKLLTLQGHPEFDSDVAESLVDLRVRTGAITGSEALDALRRSRLPNHGEVVGKAVVRFLSGAIDV